MEFKGCKLLHSISLSCVKWFSDSKQNSVLVHVVLLQENDYRQTSLNILFKKVKLLYSVLFEF